MGTRFSATRVSAAARTKLAAVTTAGSKGFVDLSDIGAYVHASHAGPMSGQAVLVEHATSMSRWIGGWLFDPSTDEHVLIEAWGTGHLMDEGSMIVARRTPDNGDTFRGLKTIFSRAGDKCVRAHAWTRLSTGRIIGVVVTGESTTRKAWAGRSDDGLATLTWTEITSSLTVANPFVYGLMQPLPAVAGGHDTIGACVTSYGGASTDVKLLYTADGGATWADRVLTTSAGLPAAAQEPSLVRLPDGRWMLLTRTAANTSVYACVAPASMSPFSAWVDTGIPLGSNVIHALVDGDYLFANVFYRSSTFAGSRERHHLVQYRALASDAGDAPAALSASAPVVLCSMPSEAVSYPQSCRRIMEDGSLGPWSHVLTAGQDFESGSTSSNAGASLVLIRQIPGPVAHQGQHRASQQLLACPTFSLWPRGTSFSSVSSDAGVAARWRATPSGVPLSVDRVEVPDAVRAALPFRAVYGMHLRPTTPGSPSDFTGWTQGYLGQDATDAAMMWCGQQGVPVQMWGWGPTPPATFRVSATVNSTSVGSAVFPAPQGVDGVAPWVSEASITTNTMKDKGIDETTVTLFAVNFNAWATSAEIDLKVAGCFAYLGPSRVEPPLLSSAEEDAQALRYCESIPAISNRPICPGLARASTTVWAVLDYEPKVGTPTISGPATAANVQCRSATDNTASGSITYTAIDTDNARMIVPVASATAGQAQIVEWVTTPSGADRILIDTGY